MKLLACALAMVLTSCATTRSAPPIDPEIEAALRGVYDVISGPAAAPRDWDKFRTLFAPGARLIALRQNGTFGVMTPDDYVTRATPNFEKNGFFERSIANRVERYGNIAHVFSTYEARHAADDAKPFLRGINSFQLVRVDGRWLVQTILWQAEDAANPIPAAYLPQ